MKKFQARHGDLLIEQVDSIPSAAHPVERNGDVILAEGEVTGHAHRIASKAVSMWSDGAQAYITVDAPADLTHEEHRTITIPPGTYKVVRQREWSLESEWRQVAD